MTDKRLAKRRLLGTAVVVLSLVVAGILAVAWYRGLQEVEQWQDAIPLAADVDISQPGTTVADFKHTCPNPHATYLYLIADSPVAGNEASGGTDVNVDAFFELMDSLAGRFEILGQDDEVVAEQAFDRSTAMSWDEGRHIIAKLPRVRPANYRARIVITEPVSPGDASAESGSGLSPPQASPRGKPVHVEVRYFLCGMEALPAILYGVGAFASGLTALVVALFTLPYVWRHGFFWQ